MKEGPNPNSCCEHKERPQTKPYKYNFATPTGECIISIHFILASAGGFTVSSISAGIRADQSARQKYIDSVTRNVEKLECGMEKSHSGSASPHGDY